MSTIIMADVALITCVILISERILFFLTLMEGIYDVKSNEMIPYEPVNSLVILLDIKPFHVEKNNEVFLG